MTSKSGKISKHDLDPSLVSFFEEIAANSGGSSLVQHRQILAAETENQTDFVIDLETFDSTKDSVLVQSGRTMLFPEADFTIEGNVIKLKEGVDVGRTIGIYIWKNVPVAEGDTYIDGALVENGSITMDKLGEDVTAELDEIKKSGSDGKSLVAGAITDKGIETAADATFEQMAANISSIVTLDSAPGLEAAEIMPGTSDQIIAAGNYLRGDQTIKGDEDLVSANIAVGKNIFGVDGSYTSDGTVTSDKMLKNEVGYANGVRVVGSIESQAAQTITPGTSNKTIAAGKYLEGTQTIKGDANLVAANIAKGKSIFGVTGTYDPLTGSNLNDFTLTGGALLDTASATYIRIAHTSENPPPLSILYWFSDTASNLSVVVVFDHVNMKYQILQTSTKSTAYCYMYDESNSEMSASGSFEHETTYRLSTGSNSAYNLEFSIDYNSNYYGVQSSLDISDISGKCAWYAFVKN